jgi:DNA mismatch repair protein MutL
MRVPAGELFGGGERRSSRPDPFAPLDDLTHPELKAEAGQTINIDSPQAALDAEQWRSDTVGYFSRLTFIGQYKLNYLVCADASGLVIVDQHAAHERITFERLREVYTEHHRETQTLLVPLRISLDTLRAAAMAEFLDFFAELGFEIEPFGGNDYALKAVPAILTKGRHEAMIKDALDDLAAVGQSDRIHEAIDAILVRMACHASIRAGDSTKSPEAQELFRQLDEIDFGSNCPHGRPVYFRLPLSELETAFGR